MDLLAFAAARGKRLTAADDELRPFVVSGLTRFGGAGWYDELVEAASVLWLEIFEQEAPNADSERVMKDFQASLTTALDETSQPASPPTEAQVHRVTYWLGTFTVNDATYRGNRARGGARMRWHTMEDESVRGSHRAANGQIASVDGTFDIGGHDLRYPGEPVGPPEIWINCRCVLVPARVEGFDVATITAAVPKPDEEDRAVEVVDEEPEVIEDELPPVDEEVVDDVEDDDEEYITEIPVHGIVAPEGIMSGDGRVFDPGALSSRNLPIPLRYEILSTHGGTTSDVVTIGRVDDAWLDDAGMYWFSGVIIVTKDHSMKVIEGIVDGSIRGVSIDGDAAVEREVTEEEFAGGLREAYTAVRQAGLTVVPIPAFQETYIALGEKPDVEAMAAALLASCDCVSTIEEAREEIIARLAHGEDPEDENPDIIEGYDVIDLSEQPLANALAEWHANTFREFPTEERKKSADKGHALPDGSYPIENVEDLKNAIQAIGRAKDPDAAKAHIRKRARELGHPELIPDTWSVENLVAAPGTHDGPGWITHPIPTSRIRNYWTRGVGAGKIKWGVGGDFNRCRRQLVKYVQNPDWLAGLCANMHKEAIGVWPGQEGGGRGHSHSLNASAAPAMTLVAAGSVKAARFFKNPGLTEPTPITITDEGYIYGHLATWGVCHVGFTDTCVQAPHSATNYAGFRTGTVRTEEGPIAVGQITMGTGHATINARSKEAVAHYDNTGLAAADVACGDDSVGVWVAGLVRPNLTDEQVDNLQAAALSGDWRRIGASLELVAALAVNVPGFPIPRALAASAADFGEEALVAAGVIWNEPDDEVTVTLTKGEVAGLIRASVAEVRHQEVMAARRDSIQPFIEKVNATYSKENVEKTVREFFTVGGE